jgi:uracil-DNA glycosylase family 4
MSDEDPIKDAEDVLAEAVKSVRKHPHAKCEECPLRESGLFVPSDGPAKAKLAFVGEAAGRNEVNTGKPFTGQSGKLLDQVNGHHRIKRKDIFLSNATLCRPSGRQNTAPPASAVAACRPRLVHELQERGVDTVVALGNVASQSLLGSTEGVSKLRVGFGKDSPYLPGVRVLPTFHPAACLRSPDFFPSLVRDVGKVRKQHVAWKEPEYKVFDDPDSAIAVIKELIKHHTDRLVIDIETDTDKDEAYDHPNNYEILCIGICYQKGKVVVIERNAFKDPGVIIWLRKLLTCKKLGAQNGKYDLAGLYPVIGPLELSFDTMLYSYAKDERRGIHALATQGVEILGTPDWKGVLDKWNPHKNGYSVIPPDVLDKYNAFDCAVTWDLIEYYQKTLSPDLIRDHDHRVKAANELVYVELNGIAIDIAYNTKLMTEYLDRLAPLEERMQEVIDVSFLLGTSGEDGASYAHPNFNPRSPKQVQEVLKAFGAHLVDTREDTLKLLAERVPPDSYLFEFLTLLLKHRREAKLYGTYVKGIRKRLFRGRVYPSFLLHGTTTGRLACRNPNLQNIPRQSSIRAQFVPSRPGRVFVQCDYSQAELRVLTWLAQEEYFRVIFNDDSRDLFNELTPVLYGNVDGLNAAARKEKRIRVKAYVYGLSYGREAGSIAQEFRIPVAEAAAGMEAFFGVIPAVVAYQRSVRDQIRDKGVLETPFGRRRRFHLITDDNFIDCYKEGLAFRPQSISSDICLRAFYTARPALKGKALIRNIVHDSILAECEESDAEYVSRTLDEIMLQSAYDLVGDYVEFKTEATVGNSWGEV